MQKQLAEKDQLLQQQALEIKYHAQIKQAEIAGRDQVNQRDNAVKLQLAGQKSALDLTKQEMGDTTKRDVAEIHAAAQLLNSHEESREEEAAADRLIEAGTTDRS